MKAYCVKCRANVEINDALARPIINKRSVPMLQGDCPHCGKVCNTFLPRPKEFNPDGTPKPAPPRRAKTNPYANKPVRAHSDNTGVPPKKKRVRKKKTVTFIGEDTPPQAPSAETGRCSSAAQPDSPETTPAPPPEVPPSLE